MPLLLQNGWDKSTIDQSFVSLIQQYEIKKKKSFWLIKIFLGRINRVELLVGFILIAILYFFVDSFIDKKTSLFWVSFILKGFILVFFFSLLTRRVSDTGVRKDKYLSYLVFGAYFFASPLLFLYLLIKEGEQNPNEDGYPPAKFTDSLKNVLAVS